MTKSLSVKYPLSLIATFLWIGFVCAISFMEAWLKFKAPGIDLPLGLGIGRLVFAALNKVEWVLAISILFNYLLSHDRDFKGYYYLFLVSFVILLAQTFYLLPELDIRADLYINHLPVPASNLHFVYVFFEALKVICLTFFGLKLLR